MRERKHPTPSGLIVTLKQKSQGICVFLDILRKLLCFNLQRGAFNLWMDTKIAEIYTSFDKALDISLLLYK